MTNDYEKKYLFWLNHPNLDSDSKQKLETLTREEKKDAFFKDIEFGTGGIRGKIGAGTNRINLYNMKRVNIGYAHYLVEKVKDVKEKGIVIAYDNRLMSVEIANQSAEILNSFGIKVYMCKDIAPTPQLSFAVRKLKASGGIMITASHNPPEYNGYKLYNEHGCQLIPEEAKQIIAYIDKLKSGLDLTYSEDYQKNVVLLDETMDQAYLNMIYTIDSEKINDSNNLKVVFSPQHGTSFKLVKMMLEREGYDMVLVEEQCSPDPYFTNTKSPNPEDNEAFEKAFEYAKRAEADIIVTTDPDADRLGVACRTKDGQYRLITGNQMGGLLLYYLIENADTVEDKYVVTTTVTSDFGRRICEKNHIPLLLVHTGFKFIGDKIFEMSQKKPEMKFLFGYEESYGYLVNEEVRDKDALQPIFVICRMALELKQKEMDLFEKLTELYHKYGFFYDKLYRFKMESLEGLEQIKRIMKKLRDKSIREFGGTGIAEAQDFDQGILGLPRANVIKFYLEDGSFIAFRPSGTEPKFKVYCSISAEDEPAAKLKVTAILRDIETIIKMGEQ